MLLRVAPLAQCPVPGILCLGVLGQAIVLCWEGICPPFLVAPAAAPRLLVLKLAFRKEKCAGKQAASREGKAHNLRDRIKKRASGVARWT